MAEEQGQVKQESKVKKPGFKFLNPILKFLSVKRVVSLLKYIFLLVFLVIIIVLLVYFFTKENADETNFSIFSGNNSDRTNNIKMPPGIDWFLENKENNGIIINTADNDQDHFLKYNISIFYEKDNLTLPKILQMRRSQIKDEIRKIISSKTFSFLKSVENQEIIRMEIKRKIQSIIGYDIDGIINVFFVEFTLH